MSLYKKSIIVTAILSIISLAMAIIFNYVINEQFWCNVCLGVFGSSVLTLITSKIGYSVERRSCLEAFYEDTLKVLNRINRYQHDLALEEKIDFFLAMMDYDKSSWNTTIGKLDFFDNKQREYIYQSIYNPLKELDKVISEHAWHFRMYKNGTGRNEAVMQTFIEEIEHYVLDKKEYHHPGEDNEDFTTRTITNRIVDEILEELNGRYYEIMYGKKKASQMEG